ncbi:MAG: M28 family peptidase [Candidatus Taylorbacteria bacterium]|nr:M28 family peptidase [Candidatus Taylorbacteria bacterium]
MFSHYDSLGPGAIDNASGTAVALDIAIQFNRQGRSGSVLFVFDGNEEISYDYPTYWGHGYREFEKKYFNLLKKTERIIVVDCVGQGTSTMIRDPHIINLAFPLENISVLKEKVAILSGDIDQLMSVYHSELDLPEKIMEKDMNQARSLLIESVK